MTKPPKSRERKQAAAVSPAKGGTRPGPKIFLHFLVLAISCALLAAIVFIALLTIQAEQASGRGSALDNMLKLTVSQTLTLVSLLQGLLALSVTLVLTRAFHYLQWGLSARTSGLPYLDFLALSPMTLEWGLVLLFVSSTSFASARMWSGLRVLLFALVWLSGIVLFFRTSLVTALDTAYSYDVTAGVGPFNASYIQPFMDDLNATDPTSPFTILPYSYYGMVNNLVTNSAISTVINSITCKVNDGECASYLLSGGVWATAPWMPPGHEEHPLVRLDNVPAIQVDFRGKHGPKNFKKKECQLLGTDMDGNLIAAELCISKIESGGIYAGIFVCTDGIVDGKCSLTSTSAPNLTTTVHFYRRQTNLLVSKDNYTITSAADFSPAIPAPIADDVEAYRDVLHWLLDYSAANIPPPSSILENFWTAREQLQNPTTDVFFLQAFQGILAFPVWLFNANNYGNDALAEKTMVDPASGLLAPEFYTRASLVRPYLKLKFDPTVLVVFGACQLVVLMFSAVVLAWAAHRAAALPSVSSFPVFDCYFKPEVVRGKEFVDPHRVDVWRAGDSEILELMKNTTVRRKTRGWESPKGWI